MNRRVALLAATLLLSGPLLGASPARLAYVESVVERTSGSDEWAVARENSGFEFGDGVRVVGSGLARLRFPWMSVTLGPDAKLTLPAEGLLALRLDRGRLAVDSPDREMLQVTTPEARIRGVGRTVVRAEPERTLVMAHDGRFEVTSAGVSVTLEAGWGTLVTSGNVPAAPRRLPSPPGDLAPGDDAVYVSVGQRVPLRWSGSAASHWVELLPVGADEVLLQSEAGAERLSLELPWPGAFRWRVASRDADGLEGVPSVDGLVCAVE